MPATLRKQRQRCRCSRRGPRSLGALISARAGFRHAGNSPQAAAVLPLLAE
ncbi:Hypothetical predicted protein, partial [Podarcis lilfordi]